MSAKNESSNQEGLQRQLNPIHVWAIAFGCIIGWGSFINPGKKFLPNSGVAVSSAVLSGIMGFYMASSRLMYSMSRDGYLPKFFGVHFCKESYIMLLVWVVLGGIFYLKQRKNFK